MPKTRQQIVKEIPMDQKAKATDLMKKHWIAKLEEIRERRQTIRDKNRSKEKDILDAYKESVGFEKASDNLFKAQREEKLAREALFKMGLSEAGTLLEVRDHDRYGQPGYYAITHDSEVGPIKITKKEADKINEVHKLLKAVFDEMEILSLFEQLEARLIMATSVGEIMAIVNAIVDQDVFEIKPDTLAIEDKKEDKKE